MLAVVYGGVQVKRKASAASVEVAENTAAKGIVATALKATYEDRDRWRKCAEELQDENAKLRDKVTALTFEVAQYRLNFRLVKRFPELADQFTSAPGALDSKPLPLTPPDFDM